MILVTVGTDRFPPRCLELGCPFFFSSFRRNKRWQEISLPDVTEAGGLEYFPQRTSQDGERIPVFLCLWSPERKTDLLAIDLDSWECWSVTRYLDFPPSRHQGQGCRQRPASVICAFRISGQRPQVSQQEATSLVASFLPCVPGRGPSGERCRDGIKHASI